MQAAAHPVLTAAWGLPSSLITSLWLAGILTKPDLVDKGTEDKVVDVVRNLLCHLKKGYMIVKCRGQKDIQERLSLAQALQRERAFFEDHPHFRFAGPASPGAKAKDARSPCWENC